MHLISIKIKSMQSKTFDNLIRLFHKQSPIQFFTDFVQQSLHWSKPALFFVYFCYRLFVRRNHGNTSAACKQHFFLQFLAREQLFPLVVEACLQYFLLLLLKTNLSTACKFNQNNDKASFEFPATSVARSKLKFRFLKCIRRRIQATNHGGC